MKPFRISLSEEHAIAIEDSASLLLGTQQHGYDSFVQ